MGNGVQPGGCLFFYFFQRLFENAQIQLINQPGFFQNRDEFGGRQQPFRGVDPPGQRLHIAHFFIHRPDNGLIIGLNPVFFQGAVKIRQDILAFFHMLAEFLAVIVKAGIIRFFDGVAGNFGPVISHADRHVLDPGGINPHADGEGNALVQLGRLFKQRVQLFLQAAFLGVDSEPIRVDVAAVFRAEGEGQELGKGLQQPVAFRVAVFVVIVFHAVEVDVQEGGGVSPLPHIHFRDFGQIKEVAQIGQAGQGVIKARLQNAFFMKGVGKGLIQDGAVFFFQINAFVHVPDLGKAHPCLGIDMLPHDVDHAIAILILQAVNGLKLSALAHEPNHRIADPR